MKYLKYFENYNNEFSFFEKLGLNEIGTLEEYQKYISSIFPNSKYKNIFQHQTISIFDKFTKEGNGRLGRGFYFSKAGNNYLDDESYKIIYTILDIKNPKYIKGGEYMLKVYSLIDERNLNSDDSTIRNDIKNELEEEYRSEYDCLIGDSNGDLINEYKVFYPKQIHILGNLDDKSMFRSSLIN